MRNHVVGPGQVKGATKGLCKAGANTIHDYYVTHRASPLVYAAKKDVHCALNPTVVDNLGPVALSSRHQFQ